MQWDELAQHALDGLVLGLAVALAAGGLIVVRSVARVTTVAQADTGVAASGLVLLLSVVGVRRLSFLPLVGADGRVPLPIALAIVLALAAVSGWLLDRLVWAPLRRSGGLIASLAASVALVVVARSGLGLALGDDHRALLGRSHLVWKAGSFQVSPVVVVGIVAALAALALLAHVVGRGPSAARIRAVADDPLLAAATGIDPSRMARRAWMLASVLAAAGGVLLALHRGLDSRLADEMFVPVLVVGLIGRPGSLARAVGASLALGVVIEFLATDGVGLDLTREVAGGVALAALLTVATRRDGIVR